MTRRSPPACQQAPKFVRHHLGRGCLAPLTGQDHRAFTAFAHLMELYAVADDPGRSATLVALHGTLATIQPHLRDLCKKLVPMVLDWSDEERVWCEIQEAGGLLQ